MFTDINLDPTSGVFLIENKHHSHQKNGATNEWVSVILVFNIPCVSLLADPVAQFELLANPIQ